MRRWQEGMQEVARQATAPQELVQQGAAAPNAHEGRQGKVQEVGG
jgi:hypothetical protein